jgi:hypothetical protein
MLFLLFWLSKMNHIHRKHFEIPVTELTPMHPTP